MGAKYTFKCNKCDYSTLISGQPDFGMIVKTNTYICTKCKEVVDVAIGYTTGRKVKDKYIGKCPICNSDKHLIEWDNKKRPCPKCDGVLERSKGKDMLWD